MSASPSCLVIHPGALGDVLLALPALAHLRALGFLPVTAVAPRLVPLLALAEPVVGAIDLDGLGLHRLFAEPVAASALELLRAHGAVVSWLGAGDPGFRRNLALLGRPAVVARAAPAPEVRRHVAWHLVETLAPLGPTPEQLPVARLVPRGSVRAGAGAWLAAREIGVGEAIVLQPGAGSPAKIWPGFADLARRLRTEGIPVVVLAGPADADAVDRLRADGLPDKVIARDWSLPRVAGLLALARGCVGNDSGPTHLAAAVGCPTIALFGPTDPIRFAPVGSRVTVVQATAGADPWRGVDVTRVTNALAGVFPPTAWASA